MKKIFFTTILIVVIIASWLYTDKQLFYYGQNKLDYKSLPMGIYPEFKHDFEGGTVIRDQYGFSLLAHGFPIPYSSSIKIQKLIKYGYNSKSILVLLELETGTKKYVLISKDKTTRTGIKIKTLSKIGNIKQNYQWVNFQKSSPYIIERVHTLIEPVFFILILYWIFLLTKGVYIFFGRLASTGGKINK